MSPIIPVILCGGSGTRLWPLSRKSFPKQFAPLIGGESLLALTLKRVAKLNGSGAESGVIAVGAEEHRFLIAQSLAEAKIRGEIVLEPVARNTAAAMAIATRHVKARGAQATLEDPLMLFCPADHHIPNTQSFVRSVQSGINAAKEGFIVTFGALHTHPSAAFGYIAKGEGLGDDISRASGFIEKPTLDKAEGLLLQGNVFWNCGIFMARVSVLETAFMTMRKTFGSRPAKR